jgi:hypothetical protein
MWSCGNDLLNWNVYSGTCGNVYSGTCEDRHLTNPTSCDIRQKCLVPKYFFNTLCYKTLCIPKPVTSDNWHCFLVPVLLNIPNYTPAPQRGRGVYCFTSVRLSKIFFVAFFSVTWWQKSDIWSQASYRYTILWVAFLDPSDTYFLFANLVGFYTHWTYMHIFRHIFLSNCWWQKSDIWSQASYKYLISWEAFLDPSDSYFLFADFVDFYTHF